VLKKVQEGKPILDPKAEDIHTAVEQALVKKLGPLGKKIHSGRSRNSQVVQDVRLYLAKKIKKLCGQIRSLQKELVNRAQKDKGIIFPGFTHLRQAQPILISHYWLSLFFMLERDNARFQENLKRVETLVLGSGALAGSGYPIDRDYLKKLLKLRQISDNSLDAVSDRDFILDFLNAGAILGMHLSRFSEDLIIYSTESFGFIELGDDFCTGSSIMPQKKNPDALELIRGKAGRLMGNYSALFTTLKGLPLAYNKDIQEDKEPLFDTVDTLEQIVPVFEAVIRGLSLQKKKLEDSIDPYILATDLADFLAKKGVPFRESHHLVGQIVKDLVRDGRGIMDMTVSELKKYSRHFDGSVKKALTLQASLANRNLPGGTGPRSVAAQIRKAKSLLKK